MASGAALGLPFNTDDEYWALFSPRVQQLRNMDIGLEREALAIELALLGEPIDTQIMVWGWGAVLTYGARLTYGYTWVPSLLGTGVPIAPGLGGPSLPTYDPQFAPRGAIWLNLPAGVGTPLPPLTATPLVGALASISFPPLFGAPAGGAPPAPASMALRRGDISPEALGRVSLEIAGGGGGGGGGAPIGIIITVIMIALSKIFGSGVSGAVRKAIQAVRDALVAVADTLMRFTWRVAHSFGWVLRGLHTLWTRVLTPILNTVGRLAWRLYHLIDEVLKPILETLDKIRRAVLENYERFVRPVLVWVQRARKVVALLAALRVPFAKRVDQELRRVERALVEPLRIILDKLNEVSGWLNILVTARAVLQQPIWTSSLVAYRRDLVRLWWSAHTVEPDALALAQLKADGAARTLPAVRAEFRAAVFDGRGPLAERIRAAAERIRASYP